MLPLSYHVQNLRVRRVTSMLTLAGMALVIFVFVVVLGLAQGLTNIFVTTGAHDNLLFLRKGASTPTVSSLSEDVLQKVRYLPEVKRGVQGEALVSAELIENLSIPTGYQETFFIDPSAPPTAMMADIRGVDPPAYDIHKGVRLIDGRRPAPGATEVMLGVGVARQMQAASVGSTLAFGRGTWTIVGLFESGGSAYESEIWTDRRSLMADRMRKDFNFVVAKVDSPTQEATRALGRTLEKNPALASTVRVISERGYYAYLAQATDSIRPAAFMLVAIMAIGMVFTGMNTMYALIAARRREIGALRAIGFGRREILLGFLLEAGVMAAAGGVASGAAGLLVNGLPFYYQGKALSFVVGPDVLVVGVVLAALIGLAGGLLPAARAARVEVVQTLRAL